MFHAKLITDEKYYKRNRWQLWITIIAAIPIGLMVNFYKFPDWVSVLILLTVGVFFYTSLQNQKKIAAGIANKSIQFTNDEIIIHTGKTPNNSIHYNIRKIKEINLPETIKMPEESLQDLSRTLVGKQRKQFIRLNLGKKEVQYDFLIESYYMLVQLEKAIAVWKNAGIKVHRL